MPHVLSESDPAGARHRRLARAAPCRTCFQITQVRPHPPSANDTWERDAGAGLMHPPRPTLNLRPSPCAHHYCFANVPVGPTHIPGLHPLVQNPTHSLPRTTKNRHSPAPPVPARAPSNTTHVLPIPTSLRHFSPPIRPNPAISPTPLKHTYIRATLAQARDRPRRPETLPPERGKAQATDRGVPCWRPVAAKALRPCPPLSRGVTSVSQMTPRRHYRFAQDRRHPQLRHAQNVAESNRIRVSASAETTVLGDARQSQTASSVSVHWTRSGGLHII